MATIPYELFSPIFTHLEDNRGVLCSISQASRTCRQEAQRVLFRNVTNLKQNRNHFKFLRTIIESPTRLALLVRSYEQGCYTDLVFSDPDEILSVMRQGLEAMRNLRRLDLNVLHLASVGAREIEIARILRGCTFNLERFDWTYGVPPDFEEILERFLPSQCRLTHLGLRAFEQPSISFHRPFASVKFSKLVSLAADWDTIKAMLPEHPNIKTVTVYKSEIMHSNTAVGTRLPVFKHVEALSCERNASHRAQLDIILGHFPSVTVLELKRLDEECHFLQQLPELHTLIISTPFAPGPDTIRRIFDIASDNLQCIDSWRRHGPWIEYLRHTRLQDLVQLVKANEVRKWWLPE